MLNYTLKKLKLRNFPQSIRIHSLKYVLLSFLESNQMLKYTFKSGEFVFKVSNNKYIAKQYLSIIYFEIE